MARKTGKTLVIVESPAKARTINKYLGDRYVVKASMGHVRDLPQKGMGVDLETFEPTYEVLPAKSKVITELKKLARQSDEVYLATDLDREGEAIAWHLKEALKVPDERAKRVIFNAITKAEIQKAFAAPHRIDQARVNAQQARRVLDRIVGFEISPVLWKKVARGLSAGRVQSVAVRLVVEREREVEAFLPTEYWSIGAIFSPDNYPELREKWLDFVTPTIKPDEATDVPGTGPADGKPTGPTVKQRQSFLSANNLFEAQLAEVDGQKVDRLTPEQARAFAPQLGFRITREIVTDHPDAKGPAKREVRLVGVLGDLPRFAVRGIEKRRTTSRPPPPFITSTLQQAGSVRLYFGAQKTMRAAQSLYEAGHITYMRTDSTHLTGDAIAMARGHIQSSFGERYLPEKPNFFASSNKAAQEAHEAIRPTNLSFTPAEARKTLEGDQARLYELIYNRFLACQMAAAVWDQTSVLIDAAVQRRRDAAAEPGARVLTFRASGRKLVFDGFMKVAGVSSDDQLLPELAEKQPVSPVDIAPQQHFTSPPPRYTEASLIKELEARGIGRPSTYATIIQTIQDRQYVVQLDRRFHATLLGKVVTDKLIQAFPKVMDVGFTADMEAQLDKVEEEHLDWIKLLKDFYGGFHTSVEKSLDLLQHAGGSPSPYACRICGKPMLYRISANGFFLACSDRDCKTTQPVDVSGKAVLREVSPWTCPTCGRELIKRRGRFGEFLSCSGYNVKTEKGEPSCSTIINLDKRGRAQAKAKPVQTPVPCGKCNNPMLLRDSKRGPFLGCSSYPKCRATKWYAKLSEQEKELVDPLIPAVKQRTRDARELAAKVQAQMQGGDVPPEGSSPLEPTADTDLVTSDADLVTSDAA